MAELKIIISATNNAKAAIDDVVKSLSGVTKALGKDAPAAGAAAKEQFEGVAASLGAARQGVNLLAEGLKYLAGGFLALKAVHITKEFADTAARTQVLGTVLRVVANNAGHTAGAIAKIDNEVQNLGITAAASRESLSKFIQSGLNIGDASKLARAAQDLAVIAGEDSSRTFGRLIQNIQQLDTLGLRFVGVTVSREVADRKYALQIGKTTEQLTQREKRQALLNEVLVESTKLDGIYVTAMGDVGKQLTSLPRLHENLADAIGEVLLPAYSKLVQQYALFLENAKGSVQVFTSTSHVAEVLAKAVGAAAAAFFGIGSLLAENIDVVLSLGAAFGVLGVGLFAATQILPLLVAGFTSLFALLATGPGIIIAVIAALSGLAVFALLKFELNENRDLIDKLTSKTKEWHKANSQVAEAAQDVNDAVRAGDVLAEQSARKRLAEAKARVKTTDAERVALKNALEKSTADSDFAKIQAAANKRKKDHEEGLQEVIKFVGELKKALGEDFTDSGVRLSQSFKENLPKVTSVLEVFAGNVADDMKAAGINLNTVSVAVATLFKDIKTLGDARTFLNLLSAASSEVRKRFEEMGATAVFRSMKNELTEVNKILEGYIETSKSLVLVFEDVTKAIITQGDAAIALAKVQASLAEDRKKTAALERFSLERDSGLIQEKYALEIKNLADLDSKKRQEVKNRNSDAEDLRRGFKAIDEDTAKARIVIERTRFEATAKLRDKALGEYKTYAEQLKAIDRELADFRKGTQATLRDIQRAGLTDERANQDKLLEAGEKLKKLKPLEGKTDEDSLRKARELTGESASIAAELAKQGAAAQKQLNEAEVGGKVLDAETRGRLQNVALLGQEALAIFKQATSAGEEIRKADKGVVESLKNDAAAQFTSLSELVSQLFSSLKASLEAEMTAIKVGVDGTSLTKMVNSVIDAFKNITISIPVIANIQGPSGSGMASGGPVVGPGTNTSDSVLLWGSAGEYMIRGAAVKHYGESFMNMINGMMLPKFAAGGSIGAVSGAGMESTPLDRVALDLSFNQQSLGILRGSRSTVQNLVGALRQVRRGGG